jgi:hypothetical protein
MAFDEKYFDEKSFDEVDSMKWHSMKWYGMEPFFIIEKNKENCLAYQ